MNTRGGMVTNVMKQIRPGKEDKVAKLEWAPTGGLGRAVIGKVGCILAFTVAFLIGSLAEHVPDD
jgi:hypothetical protein